MMNERSNPLQPVSFEGYNILLGCLYSDVLPFRKGIQRRTELSRTFRVRACAESRERSPQRVSWIESPDLTRLPSDAGAAAPVAAAGSAPPLLACYKGVGMLSTDCKNQSLRDRVDYKCDCRLQSSEFREPDFFVVD